MIVINENICSGCGRCETFCPSEALRAWGYLQVDARKCTDCFGGMYHFAENAPLGDKTEILDRQKTLWKRLCVINCPVGALSVADDSQG